MDTLTAKHFLLKIGLDFDNVPAPAPPIINSYGGQSLHEQSHGESFFALLLNRFGGKGLYILDEPEAALSPTKQMAFLSRLHELVKKGSQFLIATHSPILMTYPDSILYLLGKTGFQPAHYKDTVHYAVARQFLNNPEKILATLLQD